jgi:hypothetical protein
MLPETPLVDAVKLLKSTRFKRLLKIYLGKMIVNHYSREFILK